VGEGLPPHSKAFSFSASPSPGFHPGPRKKIANAIFLLYSHPPRLFEFWELTRCNPFGMVFALRRRASRKNHANPAYRLGRGSYSNPHTGAIARISPQIKIA